MATNQKNDQHFKMKYYRIILLSFIVIFSSCSNKTENEESNSNLIGNWRFVSETYDGEVLESSECEGEQRISFKNDSTYISTWRPGIPNPPETPPCELEQFSGLFNNNEMKISFFLENDTDFTNPTQTVTILTLSESSLIYQTTRRRSFEDDESTISILTWTKIE